MKSQRRHELETNELAKRLTVWGDRVRPYSRAITVAIVVGAVGLVAWLVASRMIAAQRQRAWEIYAHTMTSANPDWDALRVAAEEHAGTPMAAMANITWADAELRLATEAFFSDPDESKKHLDKALTAYRKLIDETDNEVIKNRARLGMGRALETGGKAKEAIEYYAAVEGPFASVAKERAERLGDSSVQEAIAWLATAEVPEIQAPLGPGTPGLRPPFGDFSIDPQIPSQVPGGLGGPLAPSASTGPSSGQDLAPPPLELENPFTGPSDPNRYAAPPQDATAPQSTPPAAADGPEESTDSQSAEEGE